MTMTPPPNIFRFWTYLLTSCQKGLFELILITSQPRTYVWRLVNAPRSQLTCRLFLRNEDCCSSRGWPSLGTTNAQHWCLSTSCWRGCCCEAVHWSILNPLSLSPWRKRRRLYAGTTSSRTGDAVLSQNNWFRVIIDTCWSLLGLLGELASRWTRRWAGPHSKKQKFRKNIYETSICMVMLHHIDYR